MLIVLYCGRVMWVYLQIEFSDHIGSYRNHVVEIKHTYKLPIGSIYFEEIDIIIHLEMLFLGRAERNAILFIATDNYHTKERSVALSCLG